MCNPLNIEDIDKKHTISEDHEDDIIDDQYIDITNDLFNSLSLITDHQVVKSDYFNLLEGTRAIEVLNPRLDTALIKLQPSDLSFNTNDKQSIDNVISIQNKLFQLLMSWLNNSSLPVTVLSCRYIQTLLENYTFTRNQGSKNLLDQCSFKNLRFFETKEMQDKNQSLDDDVEYQLVHKVLKIFSIAITKFIGICITIGVNVLYEEEDINTRNMNLDFLTEVDEEIVIEQIDQCSEWILTLNLQDKSDILISQLNLSKYLLKIVTILNHKVNLTEPTEDNLHLVEFLLKAKQIINVLKVQDNTHQPPSGSFSTFIQLDLDNKNIPSEIYEISWEDSWNSLSRLFNNILSYFKSSNALTNHQQLQNFLKYDISYNIENFNVMARGVFQLYIIRDDKSMFGSPNVNLSTYVIEEIESIVGGNIMILKSLQQPDINKSILERIEPLLQDLENSGYHNLTIYAQNPCRQQQLTSKALLLWDTLQVSWEAFEFEVYSTFKIGEEISEGVPTLPISTFIYYTKLNLMIDLAMNGIALDIYQDFEIYVIYWFSTYLLNLLIELVNTRLTSNINQKITYIEKGFPKKIKKLKAGPKKEQLKLQNQINNQEVLPKLIKIQRFNHEYLLNGWSALKELLESVSCYLIVLSSFRLIPVFKDELIFKLRLKPWSSIGVPNLPSFAEYKNSLKFDNSNFDNTKQILTQVKLKLNNTLGLYKQLIHEIENNESFNEFWVNNEQILLWYHQLSSTVKSYSQELDQFVAILNDNKSNLNSLSTSYKVQISTGHHRHFPTIKVIKRK
ncbi:glucose-repressible protein [Scheffersomyces coipomensis]|uniref:glucose-repressible protein n=1 Tax=Scheffersomyces coipomensis TaxID=1788519 RepID=UPI00315C7794